LVVVVVVGMVVVVVVGAWVVVVAGIVVVVVDGATVVVVVVLSGEVSAGLADVACGGVVVVVGTAPVELFVAGGAPTPAAWPDEAPAGTTPWRTIATTAATATTVRRVERECSFSIMPTTRWGSACNPAKRGG
jgi:hypothetical protein